MAVAAVFWVDRDYLAPNTFCGRAKCTNTTNAPQQVRSLGRLAARQKDPSTVAFSQNVTSIILDGQNDNVFDRNTECNCKMQISL